MTLSRATTLAPRTIEPWRWAAVAVLSSAALGGLVVGVLDPDRLALVIAGLIGIVAAAVCLVRPRSLLHGTLVLASLGSILQSVERTDVGGTAMSLSGFRWVAVAGAGLVLLALRYRRVAIPLALLPLVAFGTWMTIRFAIDTPSVRGLKQVIFYNVPWVVSMFTATAMRRAPVRAFDALERTATAAIVVPWVSLLTVLALGYEVMTANGPKGVLSARPLATFAVIVMCLALAAWRYPRSGRSRLLAIASAIAAIGLILFTASRTATASAVLLVTIHRVSPLRLRRLVPRLVAGALLVVIVVLSVPSLRERTFFNRPETLGEALSELNTSGRRMMWQVTFERAVERPVIGWGPGGALLTVAQGLPWRLRAVPIEYPPHNELLYVFHDGGLIALVLLIVAWAVIGIHHFRLWRSAHASGDSLRARYSLAACLAIVSVIFNGTFDNTLHYFGVICPTFLYLGVVEALRGRVGEDREEDGSSTNT